MAKPSLILGTRGSPLALAQAALVKKTLSAKTGLAADAITVRAIRTSGDRITGRLLRDVGGKALFTKEIEAALLSGEIDLAVHSLKDMETRLPEGLVLAAVLEREDPRDALISEHGLSLDELPEGGLFGTSSLRRQSQILARRPDIKIAMLRGNVETRIAKVRRGEVAATALAVAGLKRLGLTSEMSAILDPSVMLPAVGQGLVGIEIRDDNERARDLLSPLNDAAGFAAATAERAMLAAIDGDCHTPIGGHAMVEGNSLHLRARLLSPDGRQMFEAERTGSIEAAEALGADAGKQLRRDAGDAFFDLLKTG